MAHYSIFREELAIAYPTYGNALWEPDPGGQYSAVEVGDVGFIRRGYFQRLFNILHPKDHPSHRNPSFVPGDHEQLATIPDHIIKNEIRIGSRQNSIHFCSQYATLETRGRGTSASGPDDDSEVTFSCYGKQGALLSLPVPAQGEDTIAFGDFGKWMIKHIDAWFAFARGLGLGIDRIEDIILVTGRHLTKSWVNVAFTQRRRDTGVSFDVQVSSHGHVSLEQQYVRGGDLKLGPTGRDLPENQCIFIRGFRVVRILGVWPRLRGQAGPAPNAGDHEPEPESDTQLELIGLPADSDDPLHDLLQYIAEQAPDSDIALVHDDDLACIGGELLEALRSRKLSELLPKYAPTIQQFRCDLLPANNSGPGADVAVAKVATLSKYEFEAPREGPDLNPILTPGGATDSTAPEASLPAIASASPSSMPDWDAHIAEQKGKKADLPQEKLDVVVSPVSRMEASVVFTAIKPDRNDDDFVSPPEEISDKILFIINNLTPVNVNSELDNMRVYFKEDHARWFSNYLVGQCVSTKPQKHQLYVRFLDGLDCPSIFGFIVQETAIKSASLLNAEKTMHSSSKLSVLRNLGSWLGSITLARDCPINFDFKDILVEGYSGGRLTVAIPFVCKALQHAARSTVFRPPNPWLMAVIGLLAELHHFAELKLNLKFEIEVLCNGLGIKLDTIEATSILAHSMRSTPAYYGPKHVHFKEKGDGLESIRLFRRTGKPISVSKPTSDTETETETETSGYPFPSNFGASGSSSLTGIATCSPVPAPDPSPYANVHLESITLPPVHPPVLHGTVTVRNIAFKKSVGVRFTLDDWTSVSEVLATYSGPVGPLETLAGANYGKTVGDLIISTAANGWDRFDFAIKLEDYEDLWERTLWLVARYSAPGVGEFWDNNSGENYRITFRSHTSLSPVQPQPFLSEITASQPSPASPLASRASAHDETRPTFAPPQRPPSILRSASSPTPAASTVWPSLNPRHFAATTPPPSPPMPLNSPRPALPQVDRKGPAREAWVT